MKKQELNYYNEFIKNVDYAVEMATILKNYTDNFRPEIADEIEQKIHKMEKEADNNLSYVLNYLLKDFLPPIDREDIIDLSHKIDDSVDSIDEVVINLDILDVKNLREDIQTITTNIEKCYFKLKELMEMFKNSKKYEEIDSIIINIDELEGLGDRLYQQAIRTLYEKENNAVEVIKWTRIYDSLEDCFDSCKSIADCVQEIILKNS